MDDFFTTLAMLGPWMIYTILFLSAFVENVFPPFPSDVVILIGAYLVGRGDVELIPVATLTVSGSFLGFMGVYAISRSKGRPFFTSGRWTKHVKKAERWFDRYGERVILVSRFLPGVRAVVSALAGISGMKPRKVAFYAFVSIVCWYGALIVLGTTVESNWRLALSLLEQYNKVMILGVAAAAVVVIVYLMIRQRREEKV